MSDSFAATGSVFYGPVIGTIGGIVGGGLGAAALHDTWK